MSDKSNNSPSEKLVEKFAKKLFELEVDNLFSEASQLTFDCKQIRDFFISLSNESDRALSIVVAAYADDQLKQGLIPHFNSDIRGGLDNLFQSFGPLADFSSRISLAYALNWISKDTETGLYVIRKIRNEFAHRPFIEGFDDDAVFSYFNLLSKEGIEESSDFLSLIGSPDRILTTREKFHLRVGMIIMRMIIEIATAPLAIRHRLPPFIVAHAPWDKLPPPMQELSKSLAEGVVDCFNTNLTFD